MTSDRRTHEIVHTRRGAIATSSLLRISSPQKWRRSTSPPIIEYQKQAQGITRNWTHQTWRNYHVQST